MATTVDYRFVVKRDLAANFTAANTLLLQGEFALETDTNMLKMGDGSTPWNTLAYWLPGQLSKALDTSFGKTQGMVLYRDAAAWKALAAGAAGQVLQSGGPAANPSWVAPASGGGGGGGGTYHNLTSSRAFNTNYTAVQNMTVYLQIGGSALGGLVQAIVNGVGQPVGWQDLFSGPGANGFFSFQVQTGDVFSATITSGGSVTLVGWVERY